MLEFGAFESAVAFRNHRDPAVQFLLSGTWCSFPQFGTFFYTHSFRQFIITVFIMFLPTIVYFIFIIESNYGLS